MIVCFVKATLNGYMLNVVKYQLKSLQTCAEMIYPLFCETCEQKISVCFKCKLCCKNLKNCLTCFLCLHKYHVECASENKFKLNLYKQGEYKFYCDRCKESLFPFQNVDNFEYECFYEYVKPSISKINSESYKDLYSVKLSKKIV